MALKRISDLAAASALTGTELVPLSQSGTTVKATAQDIVDLASGAVTSFNTRTGAVVPASGDYTFAEIASTPTTLAGYGITDAATSAQGAKADSALQSVVAGTNVTIDNTDPQNPVISSTGGGFTNPMTASGDLIVGGASGVATRVGVGPNGTVWTVVSGVPQWAAAAGGGDMTVAVYDPAGIAQQVVGTTAAQALTHKDLTDPTNTFPATLAKDRSTVTTLTNSGGTVNIDWSLGDYFTLTLAADVTSVTSSNLPAAGVGRTICIDLAQDATGGRTFALPSSWKAIGSSDTAIQSAASAKTRIILSTVDGGTTKPYSMGKVAA